MTDPEYPYDADPDDDTYVPPADRPAEWARMAAELNAAGAGLPVIADQLCVDESTAAALVQAGSAA